MAIKNQIFEKLDALKPNTAYSILAIHKRFQQIITDYDWDMAKFVMFLILYTPTNSPNKYRIDTSTMTITKLS